MRIITGEFKHRLLVSPVSLTTRPITDKVKVALFNILGERVEDAVVLDLFCGTGSMGLECLSRGARHVYFAERDRDSLAGLRQNIAAFGLAGRSTIWEGDILGYFWERISALPQPVDLAFIDPPYAMVEQWDWAKMADDLFGPLGARLSAGGLVMLRCLKQTTVPDELGPLKVSDRRKYGKMALVFLGLKQ